MTMLLVLQAHVPDVPSAYLRDGPDGGLHAHDGLHPGRRQAIQVRVGTITIPKEL